jgi:hypothetical protein
MMGCLFFTGPPDHATVADGLGPALSGYSVVKKFYHLRGCLTIFAYEPECAYDEVKI